MPPTTAARWMTMSGRAAASAASMPSPVRRSNAALRGTNDLGGTRGMGPLHDRAPEEAAAAGDHDPPAVDAVHAGRPSSAAEASARRHRPRRGPQRASGAPGRGTSCGPSSRAARGPSSRRRTARRPRSGGSMRVDPHVGLPVEPDQRRRRARTARGRCASRRWRPRSRPARAAGASATSPRRTPSRSPSRAARRGCRDRGARCSPLRIDATRRVTLRVTNVPPRRGDSWLNRIPLQANRP